MYEEEQMKALHEVFDPSLPRLGPGDDASTLKAVNIVRSAMIRQGRSRQAALRILDLGCGNGAQTIQLAKHVDGTILAVDNYQPYLDELRRRAEAEGVSGKIGTRPKDMAAMKPEDGPFDLIWSEGALFCMGFRNGIALCRQLLAPDGFLGATELCWLKPEPPEACRKYLTEVYPDILDVDGNLAAFAACGYRHVDHFALPESAWRDKYYTPLAERLPGLRQRAGGNPRTTAMIELVESEIEMYRKFHDYFGYAFFVMQR